MHPRDEDWVECTDDAGRTHRLRWRSPAGHPPPARAIAADRHLSEARAFELASQGTAVLWQGDYPSARAMLSAWSRRLGEVPRPPAGSTLRAAFLAQREAQARRARVLGALLLPFEADGRVPLRKAPDLRAAVRQVLGDADGPWAGSLRELLGLVGAYEWRKHGVPIAALGARIHPHHGVFSPIRGEYVDSVARAPLPAAAREAGAFDIGTGTGVLAAVLARRGLRVTATDIDERALACARENLARLGLAATATVERADLFPAGRAGLVVCNPPWVPAPAATALDAAVYDPDSRMLRGFLGGLAAHLVEGGEGWLILSDLAERLGLRPRRTLLQWIEAAGLRVVGRLDTRPRHGRASDAADALHAARSAEVTSLWRLGSAAVPPGHDEARGPKAPRQAKASRS